VSKKAIVIIVVLSLITLISIVYAFVQQTLANEAERRALAAVVEADRQRMLSKEQTEVVMTQLQSALRELEKQKCK